MKKTTNLLLTLAFVALLFCTNNVSAQFYSFSPDTTTYETESPYFNIICSDTTNLIDFPLLSTNVKSTISGVIASVEIEQYYYNSSDSTLEATYVFPMSTNAAVYSMQMVINDRVIDAMIMQKDSAEQVYETAKDSGQTASLLEQHRPNVFEMSIANITPHDTVMVRMTYTELVEPEKGVYQFVVPTIVGPRYTTENEDWIFQSKNDSLANSQIEMNIDLTINSGMHINASCTSHPVSFNTSWHTVSCQLQTNPGKDFIVDYSLCGNNIETGLLLYEGEQENFFLAMVQPPSSNVQFDIPQREYVFIMDVSGSMSGTPLDVSKTLIIDILNNLSINDAFNIIFFAGGSSTLAENSLPATADNITLAIEMIDNMDAGGGTQLLPALEKALDMIGTTDYSRTFIILTDGYVSVEKQAYELVRQNLNEANFFSFGIGQSVNREIIEGLAYVGEGESFIATDMNKAHDIADTFRDYIKSPVLTNIQSTYTGITVYDVEPQTIPDVFAERPILVYGKYLTPNNGTLAITGDYGSGTYSSTLNFADYTPSDKNIALKYLWARKRIKLMSDYGIADNVNDTLTIEEEVTQLGLQYSLVTEYTSFVAVDSLSNMNTPEDPDPYPVDGYYPAVGGSNYYYPSVFTPAVGIEEDIYEESIDNDFIQIIGSNLISENNLNITISGIEAFDYDVVSISIFDMFGKIVLQQELLSDDLERMLSLKTNELAKGIYYLTLYTDNKAADTKKFVVMK